MYPTLLNFQSRLLSLLHNVMLISHRVSSFSLIGLMTPAGGVAYIGLAKQVHSNYVTVYSSDYRACNDMLGIATC